MTPIAHYCNSKYIHGKINELNINKNTGKRHYSPVLLVYKAQTHTLPYLNNLDYHAQHQGSPFILENFFCPLVYTFFLKNVLLYFWWCKLKVYLIRD